jgi:uncharacterized membrane protein
MDPIERTVNRILTVGITLSVALMAAGVVLGFAGGEGLPTHVVPVGRLVSGIAALDPAAFLSLGLLVLITTPLARVAGSLVAFAKLREGRYVLVTAIVLAVMCAGVVVGRG